MVQQFSNHSGLEHSDDISKNRANFGIFEIAYWAFLWLKLNSGQHLTLPLLSIFVFKKFY